MNVRLGSFVIAKSVLNYNEPPDGNLIIYYKERLHIWQSNNIHFN